MDLQTMLATTSIFDDLDTVAWDEAFTSAKACGHRFAAGRLGTVVCILDEEVEIMVKRFMTAEEASEAYASILGACLTSDGITAIVVHDGPPEPLAPQGWRSV